MQQAKLKGMTGAELDQLAINTIRTSRSMRYSRRSQGKTRGGEDCVKISSGTVERQK
jgi:hypothetical protein